MNIKVTNYFFEKTILTIKDKIYIDLLPLSVCTLKIFSILIKKKIYNANLYHNLISHNLT